MSLELINTKKTTLFSDHLTSALLDLIGFEILCRRAIYSVSLVQVIVIIL